MKTIDAQWIKERLPAERGAKADLAAALGIRPEAVSRMLAGKRAIKASEVPLIVAFLEGNDRKGIVDRFDLLDVMTDLSPSMKRLLGKLSELEDAELDFLTVAAEGLAARRNAGTDAA